MQTKFISKEQNDVKFEMQFTAEEFDKAQVKAYQETKDQFVIDGFRKGKAPRSIIEKKYGEGIFFEDAIDILFQENYPKAIAELDIQVVDSPKAEFSKITKGEGFTVTITVTTFPVIEVKNYKGVKIEKVEQKVSAKDVDSEIESMQKRNARMVSVDRKAKGGDTVQLDYAGFVGEEQFEGGTAENQLLKLGSGTFIPGFEEQLVGAKPGENRDVVVTFPEEYPAKDLAGKEAVFHCLVHEVKEEQLPELNDDFAQDVSEYDTLDELKKETKKRLESYAKASSENQMKDQALQKVVDAQKFDIPNQMVEDEIDRMIQDLNNQLQYQGMNVDMYLNYMQQTMQDLRVQVREDAEKSVKVRIVLENVANQEKFEISDEEMEKEINVMAAQYQVTNEQIKEMIGMDNLGYLKKDLMVKKAIEFIYENANVGGAAKKPATKAAAEKKPAAKTAEKKPAAKKATTTKAAAEKKPAAKKQTKKEDK